VCASPTNQPAGMQTQATRHTYSTGRCTSSAKTPAHLQTSLVVTSALAIYQPQRHGRGRGALHGSVLSVVAIWLQSILAQGEIALAAVAFERAHSNRNAACAIGASSECTAAAQPRHAAHDLRSGIRETGAAHL
jgi:hypothetical protein